jgi:uncharacterized membrane protein
LNEAGRDASLSVMSKISADRILAVLTGLSALACNKEPGAAPEISVASQARGTASAPLASAAASVAAREVPPAAREVPPAAREVPPAAASSRAAAASAKPKEKTCAPGGCAPGMCGAGK